MSDQHSFSAKRVFITLFILTAVEVAWGELMPYDNKLLLWGGLLAFAFWKGALIFMYFMHMKFEGWIVKVLIAPTIPLMAVVVFSLVPDVARNDRLLYQVADQIDESSGAVVPIALPGGGGHGDEGHSDHGGGH